MGCILSSSTKYDDITLEEVATTKKTPVDFAYFPVVGRGEQIRLIFAEHGIASNEIVPVGFGGDTFKHGETPHGHLPWLKDGELTLNDSFAIVQYLVEKYPGPFTPDSFGAKMKSIDAWAFVQDYYSFVLSPLHDMALKHGERFWRNARMTDTRAVGSEEEYVADLKTLHEKRMGYFEKKCAALGTPFLSGSACTYADVFLYTCVYAVQKCKGFGPFRDACGGDPFKEYPTVLAIVAKVAEREKIKAVAGKFDQAPI